MFEAQSSDKHNEFRKEINILIFETFRVLKASAHSFKKIYFAAFKINFLSLSMHIYNSDGRHAWFHLHGASRPARSASEATK